MLLGVVLLMFLMPADNPDQWSKTYTVEGAPRLRVESGDANIHVSTSEGGAIEARVTSQHGKIGGDGIQIIDRQNGNDVEIEVRFPRHWFQMSIGNHRVDIDLRVPRLITLNLHTGDGNIDVKGVKGDITLHSGDGKLELEDLEGTIRANTGDGAVQLTRARGDVSLESGDGKVFVTDLDGSLRVQTGDGPVKIAGRFDHLDIKTGDGRVEAIAEAGSSDWSLRTGDGGLTLKVPSELAANVDLQTGDGHIDLGIPVTIEGKTDKKTIRGRLNAGGKVLSLKTGDGSIRLEKL